MSESLGRKATVLTLGWAWPGFDAEYFITQDLLEHRRVRMIVFDDEYWVAPHVAATHWFRLGENGEALAEMPLEIQSPYYFASIIGMPRNLLGLLRCEIPGVIASEDEEHWKRYFHSQNSAERLGALTIEVWADTNATFSIDVPDGNTKSSDVCVYSPETSSQFQFTGPPTRSQQLKFAKNFADTAGFARPPVVRESSWDLKFAKLAREYNVKLVFLHVSPVFPADEPATPEIQERVCWPERLGTNVSMVGIAPAKLFSGLDEAEVARLFVAPDHYHFNKNGQQFFTSIITPTLLQLYEKQAAH
ncbi:MAG TPA: hypothetical protein VK742_15580 [Candidatus Sulfotelmatobacter sp.]|nr:hypothetical protein [Candidatus Sulfotelmatobacter sp.]